MTRCRSILGLVGANLLALGLLVSSQSAGAVENWFCCVDPDPEVCETVSEWCRCVDDQGIVPGGCWEYPSEIEVDCFRQHHCDETLQ